MPEDKKDTNQESSAAPWQYNTDGKGGADDSAPASTYVQPVSWQAPEYVHNQKSSGWYVLVLLASIAAAAFIYLLSRDLVSAVVIIIIGTGFTVFAARKPRVLEYSVDGTGIHIGPKTYPYGHYRSFLLLENEPIPTILLTPIRRFSLPLHIHFEQADADKILDVIGSHLPGEQGMAPPVDRLMSKIHF